MTSEDVLNLYSALQSRGVTVWIDGGWGVDALLGRQTRAHSDLDIALQEKDLCALRELLEGQGYRDVPRGDTSRWNFVLGDERGRLVDVHVFVFDAAGNVIDGLPYPTASLTGRGVIAGQPVRCIAPEYLVKFHTGYPLRDTDRADVSAMCEHFGISLPDEYRTSA